MGNILTSYHACELQLKIDVEVREKCILTKNRFSYDNVP
jgi:hypothetical protein